MDLCLGECLLFVLRPLCALCERCIVDFCFVSGDDETESACLLLAKGERTDKELSVLVSLLLPMSLCRDERCGGSLFRTFNEFSPDIPCSCLRLQIFQCLWMVVAALTCCKRSMVVVLWSSFWRMGKAACNFMSIVFLILS